MVNITHSGENVEKIDGIIEAAKKRFGLYGFEKTSMKEIAADLGLSKASIYYYFPDKEALYVAVMEKEQEYFLSLIRTQVNASEDPASMLLDYVNTRIEHFISMVNLGKFSLGEFRDLKPLLKKSWQQFRISETALLTEIIRKGTDKGIFYTEDPTGTISVFLDILVCIFRGMFQKKEFFSLDEEERDNLKKNAGEFTKMFINNLRYKSN